MDLNSSGLRARIKKRLDKHSRAAMDEERVPSSADEHRAPTSEVPADLTSQVTPEPPNRAAAETLNHVTPEPADELPNRPGSGPRRNTPPHAVASTDTNVQSSSSVTDAGSGQGLERSLWQQAYDKLSSGEEFAGKLRKYEKYVLEHADVLESGTERNPSTASLDKAKTNQDLVQTWVRKELDNISEQRVVVFRDGKQVVVRDKIYGIIKSIDKFKDVVKAAVAADPAASLAWGGAMAIIPFLQNVFQQDKDAATGFEDICFLLLQSNVVEHRLNELRQSDKQDPGASSLIEGTEQALVSLYTTALRYQIRLLVHYRHGSFVRASRDAIQADTWNEMLKDAQNANAKIASGFTTHGIETTLSELPAVSEGVKALREQMTEHTEDTRLEKLTCVGSALFDSRGVEEHGGCLEGTQIETLNTIQGWAEDPQAPFIFWLHGLAGTGKSSIALTVAQSLDRRQPFATSVPPRSSLALGASWFFNSNDKSRSSGINFVTTLTRCLASNMPRLRNHVSKAIQENLNVDNKSPGEQLRLLILDPLLSLDKELFSPTRFLIVIDAVDECSNASDLIQLLQGLNVDNTKVQIRVLITSRKEVYISKSFETILPGHYRAIHLRKIGAQKDGHAAETAGINDIAKFLKHRLSQSAITQEWPSDWLNGDKIERLTKMAGGLFLCASVACRFLDHELDEEDLDDRLQLILEGDDEYQETDGHQVHVFRKILEYYHIGRAGQRTRREREKAADEIRSILGTMAVLLAPVSITSFGHFAEKGRKGIKQKVAAFGAVVNIPEEENSPLTLIHLSFSEFLLGATCPPEFRVYPEQVHERMFNKCIDLMNAGLCQDMCGIEHPGGLVKELAPEVIERRIPQHLQYACHYWIDHLEKMGEGKRNRILEAGRMIDEFLTKKFLFWLEALSLMRQIHVAMLGMNRLLEMTEKANCPDLRPFVKDARPFLRANRWAIERAPMQIYLSALIFSPERSIIRRQFSNFIPPWIKFVSPSQQDWSPELFILEGHTNHIQGLAFSPDNTVLASASLDGTVRLWNIATGIEVQRLSLDQEIHGITFSKDGKQLALAGPDGLVGLWDPASDRMAKFKGARGHGARVVIAPRGDMLAAAIDDRHVGLWSTTDGSQKRVLHLRRYPRPLRFAPNGQILAIAVTAIHGQKHIRLWDIATDELKELRVGTEFIRDVVFLNGGQTMASAIDTTVVLWDTETWRESLRFPPPHQRRYTYIDRVVFLPDDARYTAFIQHDGTVRVFLTATGNEISRVHLTREIRLLSLSPDGRYLASASAWRCRIYLWGVALGDSGSLDDQKMPRPSKSHPARAVRIEFVPGVDHLLHVELEGKREEIWNWTEGGELSRRGLPDGSRHLFSPDGRLLVSWNKYQINFWGPTMEGQPLKQFGRPTRSHVWKAVIFSADGFVAMVGSSQTTIIKTSTWEAVFSFQGPIHGLAFAPVKGRVAWYSKDDQTLRVWDLSKWAQCFPGLRVQDFIGDILFSPNGDSISYFSRWNGHHRQVHVVKLATSEEVCAFIMPGTREFAFQLHFAADGKSIAAFGLEKNTHWRYLVRSTADGGEMLSLEIHSDHDASSFKTAISPTQTLGFYTQSTQGRQLEFWDSKGTKLMAMDLALPVAKLQCSDSGTCIETGYGNILVPHSVPDEKDTSLPGIPHECIFANESWITWGWDNILWLPLGYRAKTLACKGGRVAFQTRDHGVVLMELDLDKLSIGKRWTSWKSFE